MEIVITSIAALISIFGIAGVKIDREYKRGVIFRLGRFKTIKGPGLYWIIPFIEQKALVDTVSSILIRQLTKLKITKWLFIKLR